MLKNITLGQYYPGDTPVHRLDPRTKIILTLLLLVTIFIIHTLWGFILLAAFLVVVVRVSRVGARTVLRSMRPLLFIIILTFALNIFFYAGDLQLREWDIVYFPESTVLFRYGVVTISTGGIVKAVFMAVRLMPLIAATSIMMLTTSPMQLTDGIEVLCGPLRRVRFPVHEMAMMMSIAMRFIPTLIDETDRIMKAQTARGAEFDSSNLLKKAKNMIPLLVPLFVSAFKRADELALAMDARCYRGDVGRTRMKVLKMGRGDAVAYVVCAAFCALLIAVF
jgi:energy-coupling factor transport system permease protein